MSQENINTINKLYEAFNNREYEAVLSFFDPAIAWIAADNSPLADKSPYQGTDAIREGVFARIAAGYEKLSVRIDEIFGAEERVVVLGYYDGIPRSNGKQSFTQLAHIWTLANGKPVRFQQYIDTRKVAESFK